MSTSDAHPQFASALLTRTGQADAATTLVGSIREKLGNARPTLAVLLASAHFEDEIAPLALELAEKLEPRALIGTSGESVICGEMEYENQPALALWCAALPGASAVSFHLSQDDVKRLDSPSAMQEHLGIAAASDPHFILLGDPFSVDVLMMLERLGDAYPGRPAVGGMASAAERPRQNAMVFDGQTLREGIVGVALSGTLSIDYVVSQGCRPIGRHLVITKAERNVIYKLGGQTALAAVNELLEACPARDVELARSRGLLVGRVINEYQAAFSRGDFLIRNPIGFDPGSGAMAVNDFIRTGQTIQFHVRDQESASEDLQTLLTGASTRPAGGALLFSCNGRGTRLFSHAHHDARAICDRYGPVPVAGFFCAGEIGPIGPRNFLHGHTASVAIFRSAPRD